MKELVTAKPDQEPLALINEKNIVLINSEHLKWLMMLCPCGCGMPIRMNLMKGYSPCWEAKIIDGKLTCSPSIKVGPCGAHFWIRDGEIEWAEPQPKKKVEIDDLD